VNIQHEFTLHGLSSHVIHAEPFYFVILRLGNNCCPLSDILISAYCVKTCNSEDISSPVTEMKLVDQKIIC